MASKNNISNDWVPKNMLQKKDGTRDEHERELAALMDETNAVFNQLGVSVSSGRKEKTPRKTETCAGCNKPIEGRVLGAMDKTYHPDCFTCSQCARPIEMSGQQGTFLVRNNEPWCTKCDDWDKKENPKGSKTANSGAGKAGSSNYTPSSAGSGSTESPSKYSTGYTGVDDESGSGRPNKLKFGQVTNQADVDKVRAQNAATQKANDEKLTAHNRINQGKTYCPQCGKVLEGDGLVVGDKYYHPQCFTCACCDKPIPQQDGFNNLNGRPYHPDCYKKVLTLQCAVCGGDITGKHVVADGQKIHKECFVCTTPNCKGDMGSYLMRDGLPYCSKCANNKFTTNTVIEKEKTIQGIRFDQMSRTVRQVGSPQPHDPRQKLNPRAAPAKKFCTSCGAAVETPFCSSCGTKA